MSSVLIMPAAREVYLNLDARCVAQYRSRLVADYVADEIRRAVLQISLDPRQAHLMKYRVPKGNPVVDFWYIVVVPSPTGYDYDAAVVWTLRPTDAAPVVLAIDLQYLR